VAPVKPGGRRPAKIDAAVAAVRATQRTIDPAKAVSFFLAAAYDRWAEAEQIRIVLGDYEGADEAYRMGMLVLRAWNAETGHAGAHR
jgi:hypothetical protein